MTKPDMYLITKDFPFEHGEDAFVKQEYPYLCDKFNVLVIMAEPDNAKTYKSQNQVKAHIISKTQSLWDKILSLLCFMEKKECYMEVLSIMKSGHKILQQIYRALMFGTAAETFYRRLKKAVAFNKDTNAIFYFYWFDYKCLGMTMHKHKYPRIKIVARTHGYDLYDYRELYGRQFFKPQMDAKLDRLIFAAQFAKDYYLQRYEKQDCSKYPLHRLGVVNQNMSVEKRKDSYQEEFILLSCSNVIPLKRVGLIIDGLAKITDEKIKWIHIGKGEQLESLKEKARIQLGDKTNIQYEFVGYWTNDNVIRFYREQYIGCFITTTSTEGGSPVSVQEALSFGVPVIASSVGEMPRMVLDNGILLSENPTGAEVCEAITKIRTLYGTEEYFQMCNQSISIFNEMFHGACNYAKVADDLYKDLWTAEK